MSTNGVMTGGVRERYGRDKKDPSRAQTPLNKGVPEDLGRDERFFSINLNFYNDMDNKELNRNDIPGSYPLCFNDECKKKGICMHYQARLLMDESRHYGRAIYPTAWQNGECDEFREKRLVKKAWGFTHLYDNVPARQRADARQAVHSVFGSGNGPYYRAHHGEIMLSPEMQEKVVEALSGFCGKEDVKFDHYVTCWDFE